MAPFLTHLVIAERVWEGLKSETANGHSYGTFLFGCLAPDVDKFCDDLEQGTTHFVAKDPDNTFVWKRTQRFLENQADTLRAPFHTLSALEQAFIVGYLCHVATDEITGRQFLAFQDRARRAGQEVPSVDAVLTAMDPYSWTFAVHPDQLIVALAEARIPDGVLSFAPMDCLRAMHQIVLPQMQQGGGLDAYLQMVRRLWRWQRYKQPNEEPSDLALDADLADLRCRIEADMPAAEKLVRSISMDVFVEAAVRHSLQRIEVLLVEGEQS